MYTLRFNMRTKHVLIIVPESVRTKLTDLKVIEAEPYRSVIQRLIESYETQLEKVAK